MPDANTLERRILLPRMTAAALSNLNPILKNGQMVLEADTQKHKTGDGITPWNSLPYGTVSCINSLDSGSTADPLSAAQGKALKQKIEETFIGKNYIINSDFSRGLYGIAPNQRVTLSINQHPDGFLFLTARSEQETSTPGLKLKLTDIEYGREYTITFKYSALTAHVLMTSVADYTGATTHNAGAYEKIGNSGETRTFKQTIRINKNGNENEILHDCYLFIIWAGVSGQVTLNLWDLKMEKGPIATDWCLSEDDFAKMGDYAQAFQADGYAKLPNGLILQWMVWKKVTPNVLSTLSYPIAFPKAQTAILATSNAGVPGQISAANESQSNVQIASNVDRVNLFALGY